jgi:hypothetical protein
MASWLLTVALAGVAAQGSATPARSDFSGTWRLDPGRSESSIQGYPSEPTRLEIQQSEKSITIVTTVGTLRTKATYPMTAAPTTTFSVEGAPEGRAYWTGASLVTEGTRVIQGQTVAVKETRTLGADGKEMTVDAIVIVQHGYQFRGAKNYGAGRDVYVRVAP